MSLSLIILPVFLTFVLLRLVGLLTVIRFMLEGEMAQLKFTTFDNRDVLLPMARGCSKHFAILHAPELSHALLDSRIIDI